MIPQPDDAGLVLVVTSASSRRARRKMILFAVARIVAVTVFLVVAYFAVPVGRDADAAAWIVLVLGGVGFIASLVYQVRRIVESPTPQLRAAEALATTVVLVVVVFAFIYVCMSVNDAANFSESMTKVNGLYFTVTVLATVGFGDITATTETARIVVTGQMLINLLIVGVVVKVLLGASRLGVQRRQSEAQAATPPVADEAEPTTD